MSSILAIDGGSPAVPKLSYRRWPFYTDRVHNTILSRIESGNLYATEIDPLIEQFENQFVQEYCPHHYGLFCGSGTAALFSAYFALSLENGAEVLVPTNTFRATVTPLLLLNLRPVLCDSDCATGTIDLDDAEARITARTQALVVTHNWGHPANMDKACALASKYGLALVEDCSHAHGATWNEKPVGTFGDVSAFSLGTKKMISGGIAGILVTKRRDIYERALIFGQPKPRAQAEIKDERLRLYLGSGLGANLRGSPLAAVLALNHLERLPQTIAIKNDNISKLTEVLKQHLPELLAPVRQPGFTSGTWYAFQCSWKDPSVPRDNLLRALQAEGVLVNKPSSLLHNERLFYDPTPLTTYNFDGLPMCNRKEYKKSDLLVNQLLGWHTREMYEPANEIIEHYSLAFEKIAYNLRRLEKPIP